MDVGGWLRRLGLEQYEASFRENKIDDTVLPNLTAEDLKDLGVGFVGDRRKLLDAIAAVRAEASAPTPSLSDAPLATDNAAKDTAERRQVTVMFSDLVGSTALSARMDSEDLREVISAYQRYVAETVRRFGGFVAKYMGDGVLIYFGYPAAHEDDAERAVRAGLALVDAVATLPVPEPLQVRIGAATGMVVVGDLVGSGEAQEHDIVGETPNLAARLQAIAEPNTVVIAEATRRLLGNLFELRDLGLKELKGIAEPVQVFAALRASSVESRFEAMHPGGLTALVGREEELELLLRRWEKAKTGEGQVVLLSGEAGIGKSRLTAALLERLAAEPYTRLRYFCSPQHTDSAFYPIIGQFERAAGFAHGDASQTRLDKLDALLAQTSTSPQNAALFAEMLSLPNDGRYAALDPAPEQRREKTLQALTVQLAELARQQPVLMIFEDAHWTDPTSLEAIGRMVDRIKTLPVLLIVTFRPEFNAPWVGRSHVTSVTLNRLGEREAATIIARLVGNKSLPGDVLAEIVERTDGIPLFLEEMTKAVLEAVSEGAARRTVAAVPSSALAVPASLHASLMARLDRLGPAKEVAQIGSAIGREFSHALLASVARKPEPELASALDRLVQAGLLSRQGTPPHATYLFKHALVQDAAYSTLLREPRRALHARIAGNLQTQFAEFAENQPETLAHHFTQAGMIEAAIDWWGKAGNKALRRSAFQEAISHLGRAIEMAEKVEGQPGANAQLPNRFRLQTDYSNALLHGRGMSSSETTAAFAKSRQLATSIADLVERFSAYYGLWVGPFIRGNLPQMREVAETFMRDAEGHPNFAAAGVAHRLLGTTCWYAGDYATAKSHLHQALQLYDHQRDRPLASSFAYDQGVPTKFYLGMTAYALGQIERAVEFIEGSLALAFEGEHVPTIALSHHYMLVFAAICGRLDGATEHAIALLRLAEIHGLPNWLGFAKFTLAWAERRRHPQAVEEMRAALEIQRQSDFQVEQPLFRTLLAQAELEAGQLHAAFSTIDQQFAAIEQTGERWFEAEAYRVAGELALMSPEPDATKAQACFERALAVAREQQARSWELRAAMSMARLWRDQGKRQQARELLAPVYGWFTEGFDTRDLKEAKALLDELAA